MILSMSKKPPSQKTNFVTTIDVSKADRLIRDLKAQGFEISTPQYTIFCAKKKGISCTLYESGKLMVQGKEMASFIEFYLEPEILKDFAFSYGHLNIDTTGHIGIDEAGKGDFFGPLCIAGVFAEGEGITKLSSLGVRDSKNISDKEIHKIAAKIRAQYPYHIVRINPSKYNEIYPQFGNLNKMLAWGHATTIEALASKTGCNEVIIDKFANESVVTTALHRKNLKIKLQQRVRAESDLVVAAASILARDAFLSGLENLRKQFQLDLPKGATAVVIKAGKDFVKQHSKEQLPQVCKMHFKTIDAVL